MVIEVSQKHIKGIETQVEDKVNKTIGKTKIWDINMLLHAIESNLIPLAGNEKHIVIQLPNKRILKTTLSILYRVQLLGYVPIIACVETSLKETGSLKTIQTLITKGALIQVKASSVIGNRGKAIQKSTMKLCKNKLVHLVELDTYHSNKKRSPQKNVYKYLQKKISVEYVHFLQQNEKHVRNGTDFHVPNPTVRKLRKPWIITIG